MSKIQRAVKTAARCPETVSRLIWKTACPSSLKTWVIDNIIHVNVEEGYWTERCLGKREWSQDQVDLGHPSITSCPGRTWRILQTPIPMFKERSYSKVNFEDMYF